ncbi:hypothetical protein H310_01214 [Aphanomyces invadans]|uniref:Chloride channel protein n=1 Tax=Aphanomyces invadans TaxID=157072 RepID=A0A024UQF6_9STRA|nr:hypothetical protein H310_01214 [Aphanomyces invadans]ETW08686.1 hypothetical protein H310_01214 [Aphanomyces invadans]RHY19279.1 hypothetical protein DYB32_010253 [Aphanomyces invadans]|eukprot:XP_008862491.1 hypothetical protein H310_01214 [Aphanomyces invadans]
MFRHKVYIARPQLSAVRRWLGRLFGEALPGVAPDSWVIVPAGFAIVGATSFTAGVTGTFSIAMIVLELTQQFTYMIPVLLSVLVGRAVAGFVSHDMYETIARDKNLPQWPELTRQASYALVASDLMLISIREILQNFHSLSLQGTAKNYDFSDSEKTE